MENFWPHFRTAKIFSPVALLREQANLLGYRTEYSVVAEVKRMTSSSADFLFAFDLFASAIKYRFRLFSVVYSIDIFPIRIYPDERILKSAKIFFMDTRDEEYLICETQETYVDAIKYILGCEATKNILTAIVSHIQSEVLESA